ncbi:hypothetical protein [Aestuariirhabdus litorea]|uniref:Transcriptional regulator SutA RNAP-binding domain-containing protein n=1 Tax=Aestuariirhabdus litorea TaxID=2528527 RepID=A0A3P3VJH1_9GAMM|nr:hypothetical protein [Aestuariirhabdus litorea]RRJ82860.1 hypothetical protein D0544_13505 [Aestuariirhabdus litorea]RWW93020.1 hypothetical protein DZC74_13480 [Endozoicomonadaceae bacterium GTF-13]
MKHPPSKQDVRQQLQKEMEEFLSGGGEVRQIPRGQSAIAPGELPPGLGRKIAPGPPAPKRESLLHVTQAIDERRRQRQQHRTPKMPRKADRSPRKVPVYDDFGEVVRWEWRSPKS